MHEYQISFARGFQKRAEQYRELCKRAIDPNSPEGRALIDAGRRYQAATSTDAGIRAGRHIAPQQEIQKQFAPYNEYVARNKETNRLLANSNELVRQNERQAWTDQGGHKPYQTPQQTINSLADSRMAELQKDPLYAQARSQPYTPPQQNIQPSAPQPAAQPSQPVAQQAAPQPAAQPNQQTQPNQNTGQPNRPANIGYPKAGFPNAANKPTAPAAPTPVAPAGKPATYPLASKGFPHPSPGFPGTMPNSTKPATVNTTATKPATQPPIPYGGLAGGFPAGIGVGMNLPAPSLAQTMNSGKQNNSGGYASAGGDF